MRKRKSFKSKDELRAEISNAIVVAEKGGGATYNSINGKCTLLVDDSQVVFYDVSGDLFCEAVDCKKGTNSSSKKNYNLGILKSSISVIKPSTFRQTLLKSNTENTKMDIFFYKSLH